MSAAVASGFQHGVALGGDVYCTLPHEAQDLASATCLWMDTKQVQSFTFIHRFVFQSHSQSS